MLTSRSRNDLYAQRQRRRYRLRHRHNRHTETRTLLRNRSRFSLLLFVFLSLILSSSPSSLLQGTKEEKLDTSAQAQTRITTAGSHMSAGLLSSSGVPGAYVCPSIPACVHRFISMSIHVLLLNSAIFNRILVNPPLPLTMSLAVWQHVHRSKVQKPRTACSEACQPKAAFNTEKSLSSYAPRVGSSTNTTETQRR